jgi:hypothetical protein
MTAEVREAGISYRTFKVITTLAHPKGRIATDLVGRCFDQGRFDGVWSVDITYTKTGDKPASICPIRDEYFGHTNVDHMRPSLVL